MNISSKILLGFISIQFVLSMMGMPAAAEPSYQIDSSVHVNNIVLFAQYDSTDQSNFMAEYSDMIIELCNGDDTNHSLSGYIDAVSYGQMQVKSYFPQLKDDIIVPYKLSGTDSEYANCEQYALEMIRNIDVSEEIPLDGNSDGIVDNIILIVDGKAESMSSPIWPKAFTAPGITLNGLNVGTVNIHNSHQLFENLVTGGEGVLCHEFMHSIGYPDLYRNGRTGNPVGLWDIMASNSVFLQYPLAYQRAMISGWLDFQEITSSGTYTLSPVSSSSGNRLYLLKTPLSETEFFAVEYRQQGAKYSDELDVKIYGSGLCVYRVNTEVDGNFRGGQDQIYVFRPDETSVDAGGGDLFRSNYGGENAPRVIGSLDWGDGISEGALVYSNGTNSGIKISDIVMNEDSLTFKAEFADFSGVQLWESIESSFLGSMLPYDLENSADGSVWLLAANNEKAALYHETAEGFEAVGEHLGDGSYASMNSPKISFCGGIPYVMYRDSSFLVHIFRLDMNTGRWTEIYKGRETAQYADITSDGSRIYLAYTTGTFPYVLNGAAYDPQTDSMTVFNSLDGSNVCNLSAAVCEGDLTVAYRDLSDSNKPKAAFYTDEKWIVKKVSDKECGSVSMTSDGDSLWISPCGAGCSVYRYINDEFEEYPLGEEATDYMFMQIPVIVNGDVYTAVNTQNPDELSIYNLKGGKWTNFGDMLSREIVNELSVTESGDYLYCSWFTVNNTPFLKRLKTSSSVKLIGDVNADGKFSVADLLMMQRWILGSGVLTDWTAGDFTADGVIDSFDLCLMRKALIK